MSGFVSNTLGLNRETDEFLDMGVESSATRDVNCGGIGGKILVTDGFLFGEEEQAEGNVGIVFELEGNLRELGRGETGGEQRIRGGGLGKEDKR
ncbi:hypothetical protein V6N13_046645 [Hibiscus sabdariffa]|uniref:Uncharacterized protein n=2 Tax=Hibiscus sabdariffa TaxID=183260 RepID=A0ABR2NZK1_9ROSI